MPIDYEHEIVKLGKICEKIAAEMTGVQHLLQKLMANQDILMRVSERTNFLEKNAEKAEIEHNEIFQRLRCIEQSRLPERVNNIEASQRWGRVTFFCAIVTIFAGCTVAWIKTFFEMT